MARLTFAQIRQSGAVLAGNLSVDSWITTKFNGWLRKHYTHFPWPFLMLTATNIPFSGSNIVEVGAEQGGSFSRQISRVFGPIYWRRQDSATARGTAKISQQIGQSIDQISAIYDTTISGPPCKFTIIDSKTSAGLFYQTFVADRNPDVPYYLTFQYQHLPNDLADTDVPTYPNELTLIQVAKCAAIEYDNSNTDWFTRESDILASMVAADRDAYGGTQSFGDTLVLDPSTFL